MADLAGAAQSLQAAAADFHQAGYLGGGEQLVGVVYRHGGKMVSRRRGGQAKTFDFPKLPFCFSVDRPVKIIQSCWYLLMTRP